MITDSWQIGGLALALALALLGLAAWLWAWDMWQRAGLPAGDVIASDMGHWYPQKEPLYDPELELTGQPDYLIQTPEGDIVPVEVKSTPAPPEPYASHVLQLAAYCVLVEANYGQRPFYGILQYRDRAFAIDFTAELEEDFLDVLAQMRADIYRDEVDRDHQDIRRCLRCGVRDYCDQRLA
ncbi:MAG TPA: PD-(D/E)XK nuclease family protein [Anaerolineae bacterium]|nr:PD-(D/E)XK nuclease family protein [Anaerolineae bacterium]